MRRLGAAGLLRLGDQLPEAERELLDIVERLRLVTHAQLACLMELKRPPSGSEVVRPASPAGYCSG